MLGGIQKLSLLDYPHKLCSTLFTQGCNLRCPYCHNPDLVLGTAQALPTKEVLNFLKSRQGKLDAVCITGGEPLLHTKLADLLDEIKALGFAVKLDSNGCFPDRLHRLLPKLDYVAMDIKNSLGKYAQTVGLAQFDTRPILESIALIQKEAKNYAFRTTLMQELHEEADMHKMGELIKNAKRYELQNFAENGRRLSQTKFTPLSPKQLKRYQEIASGYVQECILKNPE